MVAAQGKAGQKASTSGTRKVYFAEHGFLETAIYRRASLQAEQHLTGPCLVEELASTTVIPPTASADIDASGNLIIDWERSEQ
jgi:N-methylhydantoinase A